MCVYVYVCVCVNIAGFLVFVACALPYQSTRKQIKMFEITPDGRKNVISNDAISNATGRNKALCLGSGWWRYNHNA